MWKKTIILALACPLAGLHAQSSADHGYTAKLAELTDALHEKMATEALVELDPDGLFICDASTATVEMWLGHAIDQAQLHEHLGPYGFTVIAFHELGTTHDADGFPELEHSGDPVKDHADYQAAKVAWIAAHPDAYEALLGKVVDP